MDLFANSSNSKIDISIIKVLEDFTGCLEHLPDNLLDNIYFKGGLSLLSAMNKYGRNDLERMTEDIDIQCNDLDIWSEVKDKLEDLSKYSSLGFSYKIIKIRDITSNGKSETITIEATNSKYKTLDFKIDMNLSDLNVNYESYITRFLSIDFTGYSVESILVDKLHVFSSRKIFRRCKDLYDIYAISKLRNINMSAVLNLYYSKYGENNLVEVFGFDLDNLADIEHAYNTLQGINDKPKFNLVYNSVCNFALPIFTNILNNSKEDLIWDYNKGMWSENAL